MAKGVCYFKGRSLPTGKVLAFQLKSIIVFSCTNPVLKHVDIKENDRHLRHLPVTSDPVEAANEKKKHSSFLGVFSHCGSI